VTTLLELYEAVKVTVQGIPGMRGKDHVPGDTEFPVAFPEPPVVETDNLADDTLTITFDLVVLVSAFDHRRMNDLLKYQDPAGTHSVLAAFKADRTLGLPDVHVHAGTWRPLGLQEMSYYRAWGAALTLTVLVGEC
jgi:hypothetical protein